VERTKKGKKRRKRGDKKRKRERKGDREGKLSKRCGGVKQDRNYLFKVYTTNLGEAGRSYILIKILFEEKIKMHFISIED
jgi:hypothetical protein